MNEEHSKQIFESLLREMLTGQHPPDLTKKIVNAWRREQTSADAPTSVLPKLGLVKATPIRPGRINPAGNSAVNQAARSQGSAKLTAETTLAQRLYRFVGIAAACAAGVGFVIWSFQGQSVNDADSIAQQQQPSIATATQDSQSVVIAEPKKNQSETLELSTVPFEGSQPHVATLTPSPQRPSSKSTKMDSKEVVAEMNQRLDALWRGLDISPSPAYEDASLAERMSLALTGEKLRGPVLPEGFDKSALTTDAIQSRPFAKYWAGRFATEWLKRSSIAADSESWANLTQAVATKIEKNERWNNLIVDLLGGDLETPDAMSHIFVGALAGGENHRLVERIGSNFLNANLACVRCHDQGAQPNRATDKQETYWSLVAMLKGLDAKTEADSPQRIVTDRQLELFANSKSRNVFYDLPSGVLKSAAPKLPDGSDWDAAATSDPPPPRQVLAEWISQSPDSDRATVNQVWKMVFGRLLVPHIPQTDLAGLQERSDLLDFLAQQFRAHDHDLKQLVGWVVNSQAFAKQPLELQKSQWLETSDEELERFQLREMVFAAGPTLGRGPEAKSLDDSLAAAVQWNRPAELEIGALAQRADIVSEKEQQKPADVPTSVNMPAMSFVLHGQRHTLSQQRFVKDLLGANRLSWEERVEHVVGLGGRYAASTQVQQHAKELLEQNSGDMSATLLYLLWAVQNADAE